MTTGLKPAGWRAGSRATPSGRDTHTFIQLGPAQSLRLWSGEADAGDPSHFVLTYAVNGRVGHFDGWLGAPGQTHGRPGRRRARSLWN